MAKNQNRPPTTKHICLCKAREQTSANICLYYSITVVGERAAAANEFAKRFVFILLDLQIKLLQFQHFEAKLNCNICQLHLTFFFCSFSRAALLFAFHSIEDEFVMRRERSRAL
jgi:hypothetical protein